MFTDAHAHLTDDKYGGEIAGIIKNYREAGVGAVVDSGFDVDSSLKAAALAEKYDDMYFTAGVHPDEASTFTAEAEETIRALAAKKKCVGIGETGFDFHWNKSPEKAQEEAFEKQLFIAREFNLPVVIHSRDATKKTLDFLKERRELLKNGFLMHCFGESEEIAREYVELGSYFSFGGVITFRNAKKEGVIRLIPSDRILTETDCPYLSPEPFRGTVNDPSRIPIIAKKLAEVKGVSLSEAENITETNFKRFYRI